MKKLLFISIILLSSFFSYGQSQTIAKDSVDTSLKIGGDYRFRVEHDWSSRKSNGTFRNDRSRLRYRLRFGISKNLNRHFKIDARIRTGNLNDQQGPHVTLGKTSEFGLTSIGFEKANIQYKKDNLWAWIGKNSFPFWKQHELLWNDNVFPEGIAIGLKPKPTSFFSLAPSVGHFIINSSNQLFKNDQFLTIAELNGKLKINNKSQLIYNVKNLFFNDVADIPDGKGTFFLDYNILASSVCYKFKVGNQPFALGVDWYQNTINYDQFREAMEPDLMDEKMGYVAYLKYGKLKTKGDISIQLFYANIGKYAIVDYFAQNDWARWDYSGSGATGSRLSNFKGVELRMGYKLTKDIRLVARYYNVEQLVALGSHTENGSRFRIDLDAKF